LSLAQTGDFDPDGHPKSPSLGHFKFPHLAAQQHDVLIA
jgi:hypothetical protein